MSRTPLIERLAAAIGGEIYIDVAKWHLYLRDAKLHTPLAEAFLPLLEQGEVNRSHVQAVLQEVSVPLGVAKSLSPLTGWFPKRIKIAF
ncbi:DUF3181 family protein [Parathermosynechococcus lividus]|uniref:DUF3181 family protein n=1 Tax=Parathermosynechococcus lividus TaxID=33070 RepID=UPI001D0D4598|nr:DUF3181 family protein [Thermostichus lividus]